MRMLASSDKSSLPMLSPSSPKRCVVRSFTLFASAARATRSSRLSLALPITNWQPATRFEYDPPPIPTRAGTVRNDSPAWRKSSREPRHDLLALMFSRAEPGRPPSWQLAP